MSQQHSMSTSNSKKKYVPGAAASEVNWSARCVHSLRMVLMFIAFCMAILPSVLKIYETSHWFREYGDPSDYDKAKDWFNNPNLPFQKQIDNPKILMRIYFFILPYIAMAACLVLVHMLPKYFDYSESVKNPYQAPESKSNFKLPSLLVKMGAPEHISVRFFSIREIFNGRTLLRRSVPFPKFLIRWCGAPDSVSTGEILGVAMFLVLNLGTIGVRVRRSLPRGTRKNTFLVDDGDAGKEEIPAISWPAVEVWGKTLGVVAIVNLGWYLLMPVGRKSVLLESMGMSWDRAIKYHRWVGFYTRIALLYGLHPC